MEKGHEFTLSIVDIFVNHRELFDDLRETVFKTVAFVRSAILPNEAYRPEHPPPM
jgi:hypothetical protein